jgi:hypothetical protein
MVPLLPPSTAAGFISGLVGAGSARGVLTAVQLAAALVDKAKAAYAPALARDGVLADIARLQGVHTVAADGTDNVSMGEWISTRAKQLVDMCGDAGAGAPGLDAMRGVSAGLLGGSDEALVELRYGHFLRLLHARGWGRSFITADGCTGRCCCATLRPGA